MKAFVNAPLALTWRKRLKAKALLALVSCELPPLAFGEEIPQELAAVSRA